MTEHNDDAQGASFDRSRLAFETVLAFLEGEEATALAHGDLEARLEVQGRALLCQLFQDHLDLRAHTEARIDAVTDAQGIPRGAVETGHPRRLTTVFGEVEVRRRAYRRKGQANLHPADAVLNLPTEKHSHGLRRQAALEAARGSFDGAVEAIQRSTRQALGKRQTEGLAARSAVDFDDFYAGPAPTTGRPRRRGRPVL